MSTPSKFAIGALMGALQDEAVFSDPFGLPTQYTIRRDGSKALEKLSSERRRKDRFSMILTEAYLRDAKRVGAAALDLGKQAGLDAEDILKALKERRVEEALQRLVKWEGEPNGIEYNNGTARELLTHDGILDRDLVPEETWKLLEEEARETWEAVQGEEKKPFPGLKDCRVGEAYVTWIHHASAEQAKFRVRVMEEAGKN